MDKRRESLEGYIESRLSRIVWYMSYAIITFDTQQSKCFEYVVAKIGTVKVVYDYCSHT